MRNLDGRERRDLQELEELVGRAERGGLRHFDDAGLERLPRLYRRASTIWVRLESGAHDPNELARVARSLARTHLLLFRDRGVQKAPLWRRAIDVVFEQAPGAIRAEWKLVGGILVLFYALATAAFWAVSRDLSLAYSLFDEHAVAATVAKLEALAPGERFRGNFTFGIGESPQIAGQIFAHNIAVSVLFFGAGLIPPLFLLLLVTNALMLGTYTALAAHWGQALSISSILWCHGVIELQMIVLAGAAGLVLIRAWIAPGRYSRRHAMRLESRRAACLFAPVAPFLIFSGLLEGFVSPHASTPVALGVALLTLVFLVVWITRRGFKGSSPR